MKAWPVGRTVPTGTKNGYGAHTELECAPLDGWPEL